MTKLTKLAFSAALSVLMIGGISSSALAQDDIQTKIIPSLEYEQADVREALRALFKAVGVSYSVAPEVQGTVTVSLKNVTFEAALQQIVRQVDATYRIESGIWQIVRREVETPTGQVDPGLENQKTSNKVVRRIHIQHADPQFIAILMGGATGSQNFSIYPELSTVYNTPNGNSNGGNGNNNSGRGGSGSGSGFGSGSGSNSGSSFGSGSSSGRSGGSSGGFGG